MNETQSYKQNITHVKLRMQNFEYQEFNWIRLLKITQTIFPYIDFTDEGRLRKVLMNVHWREQTITDL
jgi:hypothetical protein